MANRIITRGLGGNTSSGLITQGYAGFFEQAIQEIKKIIHRGGSKVKKELEESFHILVQLIEINKTFFNKNIFGESKKTFNKHTSAIVKSFEHYSTRTRCAEEDTKILMTLKSKKVIKT